MTPPEFTKRLPLRAVALRSVEKLGCVVISEEQVSPRRVEIIGRHPETKRRCAIAYEWSAADEAKLAREGAHP